MMRQILVGAALVACVGCQSPGSWNPFAGPGYRVQPPPTGSYGGPSPYYQPSATPGPGGVPPVGNRTTPLNRWSSVPADNGPSLVADTSSTDSSGTVSPRTVSASNSSTVGARAALNGMPVNQVRTAAEPGRFTPSGGMGELKPNSASTTPGTNTVQPASAAQPSGTSSRSVSSATWQSRSAGDSTNFSSR